MHIRLNGVSKIFQGKTGFKVEPKLYQYVNYAGRKQPEPTPTPKYNNVLLDY